MVLNPHKAKQKVAIWFATVVKTMRENGQPVNLADILRYVRLNFPVSLKGFKEEIFELYVEPGILRFEQGTGDLVAVNNNKKNAILDQVDNIRLQAEKEADLIFNQQNKEVQ